MKSIKLFALTMLLAFGAILTTQAQVTMGVTLENQTYEVSLISSETWTDKDALTSTAQVSLVVPQGFILGDLQDINGTWEKNAEVFSPDANPDFDYISIGLTSLGTADIEYVAGEPTVLFTFKNAGVCNGAVELVKADDAFANNGKINILNQITTLGSGNTNAWTGNHAEGSANCEPATNDRPILNCTPEITFNQATSELIINSQICNSAVDLSIFDLNGSLIYNTTGSTINWQGETNDSKVLPASTYLYQVTNIDGKVFNGKMSLLK